MAIAANVYTCIHLKTLVFYYIGHLTYVVCTHTESFKDVLYFMAILHTLC